MSAASVPLVPALAPSVTASRRDAARYAAVSVLVGVVAIAAFAQLRIDVGPVPITGQTLPVLVLGFAVGPRLAVTTVAAYLALGAAGAPVFSNLSSGTAVLTGATGGYLVGFLLAAALVGWLGERGWHAHPGRVVVGMVAGNVVIYALGVSWLAWALALDAPAALAAGLTPFLLGDAVKIAVAAAVLPLLSALARR